MCSAERRHCSDKIRTLQVTYVIVARTIARVHYARFRRLVGGSVAIGRRMIRPIGTESSVLPTMQHGIFFIIMFTTQ